MSDEKPKAPTRRPVSEREPVRWYAEDEPQPLPERPPFGQIVEGDK